MSDYSAVSAKIRSMYGKHLELSDYENLLSKGSVSEMCAYLKNETAYGDVFSDVNPGDMHREVIEHRLAIEAADEYARIYSFLDASQQSILEFWHYRSEIKFLKGCLMNVMGHESKPLDAPETTKFLESHTKIKIDKCINAKSLSDFVEATDQTPYKEIFLRATGAGANFFTIAMTLDGFYFKKLFDKAENLLSEEEVASLKKLIGSKSDMLNIMWIYRGKKYFKMDPELIYTYIIPVRFKLTGEMLKSLVTAETPEAIPALLEGSAYEGLFYKADEGFFAEENYRRMLYKNAKAFFRKEPDSMAAIFAYLYLKRFEVLNITCAIEGIRYGIEPEAILKRIKFSREAI